MKITHPVLVNYINNRPELGPLSDWHIDRIERNMHWPEWKSHVLRLCFKNFAGDSICCVGVDNGETEQDLATALCAQLSPDHTGEDEALMLYGA